MVTLYLEDFRVHEELNLDLSGGTILLKGVSGQGKTTIFEAISWALYGSTLSVTPLAKNNPKTVVELNLPGICITRSKKPSVLKVATNTITLLDKEAQDYIHTRFGYKEIWESCCYLQQEMRPALLSGSQSEKIDILTGLTFLKDDPREVIEKVESKVSEIKKEFDAVTRDVSRQKDVLSRRYPVEPESVACTQEEITMAEKKIPTLITQEAAALEKCLQAEKDVTTARNLSQEISELQQKLQTLPAIALDLFMRKKDLEHKKQQYWEHTTVKGKIDKYSQRQQQLQEFLEAFPESDVTLPELQKLLTQKQVYDKERDFVLKKIGCEYTSASVSSWIQRSQKAVDSQSQIIARKEAGRLQVEKSKYKNIPLATQEEVDAITSKLSLLQQSFDVINCPECQAPLRYKSGVLQKSTSAAVDRHAYNSLLQEKNVLEKGVSTARKLKDIDSRLSALSIVSLDADITELSAREISDLRKNIATASTLTYVIVDETVDEIQDWMQAVKSKEELQDITQKLETLKLSTLDFTHSDLTNMEQEIERDSQVAADRHHIERTLRQKETQYSKIVTSENVDVHLDAHLDVHRKKLTDLRQELEDCRFLKDVGNKYYSYLSDKKELDELLEKENTLSLKLTDAVALKNICKRKETEILEGTVSSINVFLEELASEVFEKITVELRLQKTLKTTKQVKDSVNFYISKDGVPYNSFRELSGGEKGRLSFILYIVLANLNPFPLLLIDECFASLDAETKEKCISVLKKCSNKTIVCINHDGTEGFFDRTISL